MTKVNGGDLFAKALKKEGVDTVFTLVGGHILPILYGCKEADIKIVDCRHECVAGNAADAYAKVSGHPGVVITTAGPGVTNATTAMAEAMESCSPLIHIGGGSPRIENETGPLQNVQSFEAMAVFCKWSRKIQDAKRVPEYVSMAFRNALAGTPGPVYLEIPQDVLKQECELEEIYWPEDTRTETEPFGDPIVVEAAADALAKAKCPAMVIGAGARYHTQYGEAIEKLVNYLKIPVLCTVEARGLFADETANELFTLGAGALGQADVILELGVDHSYKVGKGRAPMFNKDAVRIMVHQDSTKIGYNAPANFGIIAGAGAGAMQLFDCVKSKVEATTSDEWVEVVRERMLDVTFPFDNAAVSEIQPPHPGRVATEVEKFIDEEAKDWHIVCDGGDSAGWMDAQAKARYPGQIVRYGPLGTIGTGQGFTLGSHFADKKPVLYYTGDGSLGFYSMDFDTYARHGVPVVCVISNDSAWGMIKLAVSPAVVEARGRVAVELFEMRAYHKMPEVWGGVGVLVTRYEDIIPAIRKVRDSGLPGIVNVQVDQHAMTPATRSFGGLPPMTRDK
jgi:acetolactate synthase-1/2/3 large subunit